MANAVSVNTLINSGENTETRLVRLSIDTAGTVNVPITLGYATDPIFVHVTEIYSHTDLDSLQKAVGKIDEFD